MNWKASLLHFANQTSMHGVPKVILARSLSGRLVWSLLCILAGAMFCNQLSEIIIRYFSYPKKITVEVVPTPVPFPAVSLCNMRNMDFYVLNLLNRKFHEDPNPVNHINATEGEFYRHYMTYVAKFGPLYDLAQHAFPKEFQDVFSRTSLSSNIPQSVLSEVSVQLSDFIVTCYYGGNSCNISTDFTTFFDSYYFNCFTYKPPPSVTRVDTSGSADDAQDNSEQIQLLSEGIENGWSAILLTGSGMLDKNVNIDILPGLHESRSATSASDGVRVVIHPPDTRPLPLTEGYDIPPGFSVSLGIRPRRTIRVGPPHGNCTTVDPFESSINTCRFCLLLSSSYMTTHKTWIKHYRVHIREGSYRSIYCTKLCLQRHVVATCECYDETLPTPMMGPTVPPCRLNAHSPDSCMKAASKECLYALLLISERVECTRRTRSQLLSNSSLMNECACHQPCNELFYDVSYSLAKWPAHGYEGDSAYLDIFYIVNYTERFRHTPDKYKEMKEYFKDEDRENTMKNFARLNVYVADSNVLMTQESSDYQPIQVVSDIGGQLGLWVGISVITIAEVVELVIQLVCRGWGELSVEGAEDDILETDHINASRKRLKVSTTIDAKRRRSSSTISDPDRTARVFRSHPSWTSGFRKKREKTKTMESVIMEGYSKQTSNGSCGQHGKNSERKYHSDGQRYPNDEQYQELQYDWRR